MTEYMPGAQIPDHLCTLIQLLGGTVTTKQLVFPHGRYDKRVVVTARLGGCKMEYGTNSGQWIIWQAGKHTLVPGSLGVEDAVLELIRRAT